MNPLIEIWNILHDGELTAYEDSGSRRRLFVSIPYLRRRFEPMGDSFILTFSGVKAFEYREYDGTESSFKAEFDSGRPEILSTDSADFPITIHTTTGALVLDYEDLSICLDSGDDIDFKDISKASEEYWNEWNKKAEQSG